MSSGIDYPLEETVHILFTTRAFATGIPGTLSAATVAVYEDGTATPIETSVAVTEDLNSIVGLNMVPIAALAASGYNAGASYHVVIEAGTVDSVSVVGEVVGSFSIGRSAALAEIGAAGVGLAEAGGDGDHLSAVPWNATWDAEVQSEVADALVAIGLDHLISAADGDDPVDGSIIAHMVSATEDWSTFVPSADSLEAAQGELANLRTILAPLLNAFILTSATIETVTSQTALVIPATADATDDDAYIGALAVLIDGSDPNQKSYRLVIDYDAGTRTVTLSAAPDFTVTTADTLTILATASATTVWDRILTGNTHNITNSAGKRLRAIDAAFEVHSGTAQAGSTSTTIKFDTGASVTDNIYRGDRVIIVGGTGAEEHGIVVSYVGSTRVATMAETWVITPDNTSEFVIVPATVDVETIQHTIQTAGDLAALIGSPAGASMSADILEVKQFVDNIMPAKNTDLANVEFLMVDDTDHVTPKTGLTITVTRSIDGGAFGAKHASTSVAEVASGIYQIDINGADLNGDIITFRMTGTDADDRFLTIRTAG